MSSKPQDEESIFHTARAIASPRERGAYLQQACGDNEPLRARVEQLLKAFDQGEQLIATLALKGIALNAASLLGERPGTTIDHRYKLLEQIGEGGMGVVFMAEQVQPVHRRVALKIIKPGMDTRQVTARFEAERQALAMMDHPNIARVFEAGTTESGRPYFVMELVKGVPITQYCDQEKLSPRRRLELFVFICQAIQHAHQKGIIHRDLKPTNILISITDDGKPVPKVIDFGIAKATFGQPLTDRTLFTEFHQLVGTPLYMSPEQAETRALLDVDTRSDVYSLGVLLYELLTGTTPFDKQRLAKAAQDEVRRIIRDEDPPRPSTRLSTLGEALTVVSALRHTDPNKLGSIVRGELDWIVMKALEKDRQRRYETASSFARDIERYLSDQPVEACPPSRMYRLRKAIRRNKAAMTTTAMVALALLAGTAISTWEAVRATRSRTVALAARDRAAKEEQRADAETVEAQRRLADSTVAEARLLLSADRVGEAKVRLRHATDIYASIGRDPLAADLVFLDAVSLAPQPLNRIDVHLKNRPRVVILPAGRSAIIRRVPSDQRPGLVERIDLRTGEVLQRFALDQGIVADLAVSRDGRLLLTGGGTEPFDVTLWDVQQGRVIRTFKGHTRPVNWVALSNGGRRVFTCGSDRMLKVWDAQNGKELFSYKTNGFPNGMAASPDGRLVAVAENGGGKLWNVDTGALMSSFTSHFSYVEFSPDGKLLDRGAHDLWDVQHQRYLDQLDYPVSLARWSLSGYPGQALVREFFPASKLLPGEHQRAYLTDDVPRQTFQISISDDERFAATASTPAEIAHWPIYNSVDIVNLPHTGGLSYMDPGFVLTLDGLALISTNARTQPLKVWDVATGLFLCDLGEGAESTTKTTIAPSGPVRWATRHRGVCGWEMGALRLDGWRIAFVGIGNGTTRPQVARARWMHYRRRVFSGRAPHSLWRNRVSAQGMGC